MFIEVAMPIDATTKDKGDLLEKLASELLGIQSYQVSTEVRVTASELDLLCTHKINRRQIYVECKAHRSPLSSDILTKLLGTITLKEYQEGWLISTGPLGKDAKGFQSDWEQKPVEEAQKLSIYTPERVVDALMNAHLIVTPPETLALEMVTDSNALGDWVLLITPYGRHWLATVLIAGVPEGVLVFSAKTGKREENPQLLTRLSNTDTSLGNLDFHIASKLSDQRLTAQKQKTVVEVQQGESWSDYRPARPEDFVGREDEQDRILHFFEAVRSGSSITRIFAIIGDSGMGKSSLIAKLRSKTRSPKYRNRYFTFAVDVRAATHSSYILNSLLTGLQVAAQAGFGELGSEMLRISNPAEPLASESIQKYLETVQDKGQVICIVFDQFEELYSKTELFSIFETAKNLFMEVTASRSNLALGFAWKTDATIQQDHPAYYMWHNLADHRLEIRLRRFTHAEATSAITVFEKELATDLRSDLRRQLIENSQGYPWLLKKLAIHVYEQVKDGISQWEIMNNALDVKSLFKRDLQVLSRAEDACLKLIARSAPANWYEILDATDQDALQGLLQKRLVVRSGDRFNLYWDIFREFVLTGTVPSIPMTYLPTSPSLRTMLSIAQLLEHSAYQSQLELGNAVGISEKSAGNIIRDLVMFGIASRYQSQVALSNEIKSSDPKDVLRRLRQVLRNHALTISLFQSDAETVLSLEQIIDALKRINPAAQHQQRTWKIYAERMAQWLSATGYLQLMDNKQGWKLDDMGEESINPTNALIRRFYTRHPQQYRENTLFIGDTSPYRTAKALEWLVSRPAQTLEEISEAGHRNGSRTLLNLRLIRNENRRYVVVDNVAKDYDYSTGNQAIWKAASKEPVMELVIGLLERNHNASGADVGELVAKKYERVWTPSSQKRIGISLRQWGVWLITGKRTGTIPAPPGRGETDTSQLPLL